jgi:catechol 1,2-dioxygenase
MDRKTFLATLSLLPVWKLLKEPLTLVSTASCKTQSDQEGPYYKEGAPIRTVIETDGNTLVTIEGKILSASDCKTPVANAIVDIWHCDNHGKYDNEGFNCRGMVNSDKEGNYMFTTILPPSYGSRPRHIHFKIRANGFPELTSQIYFKGDPNLKNDFARKAEAGRILETTLKGNTKTARFDIYI